MTYQLIVHGGANNLVSEDFDRRKKCEKIADSLEKMLIKGGNALDVCEHGIKLLEDDIAFNAGTGAYLQIDGKCRLDACLMDSDLRLGSVIQIENIKNPISVARKLLERNVHSSLCGEGAIRFAQEQGIPLYSGIIEKQSKVFLENLKNIKNDISYESLERFYAQKRAEKLGTVGCVVRDANGYIVAGTSTGGLKTCFSGRVGDTPMVGCGNYANKYVGVSCTGVGEKIMRVTLARTVAFGVQNGLSLKEALQSSMNELESIDGAGGIIAISHTGEVDFVFNTKVMSYALRSG